MGCISIFLSLYSCRMCASCARGAAVCVPVRGSRMLRGGCFVIVSCTTDLLSAISFIESWQYEWDSRQFAIELLRIYVPDCSLPSCAWVTCPRDYQLWITCTAICFPIPQSWIINTYQLWITSLQYCFPLIGFSLCRIINCGLPQSASPW